MDPVDIWPVLSDLPNVRTIEVRPNRLKSQPFNYNDLLACIRLALERQAAG